MWVEVIPASVQAKNKIHQKGGTIMLTTLAYGCLYTSAALCVWLYATYPIIFKK